MKTILVAGGAGYIGSHMVALLAEKGYDVVVVDNLRTGHWQAVKNMGKLYVGDLRDAAFLDQVFHEQKIDGVINFAAYSLVGESVTDPLKYYENNIAKPLVLLRAMILGGCKKFVFSSTCATYGVPTQVPIPETEKQDPINPYGGSKFMLEKVCKDCERAYGLKSVFLRYFNASGSSVDGAIGEDHDPESHLIPVILQAIKGERPGITVFGTDYDTPDGTCIRDYIHVDDLADAHLRALDYLMKGGDTNWFNLGTGKGLSVKEIIDAAEKVTGKKAPVTYGERREGDPPRLIADARKAAEVLGWIPKYQDAHEIVATAWKWFNGPRGGHY